MYLCSSYKEKVRKKKSQNGLSWKGPIRIMESKPKKIPTLCLRVLFGCSLKFYSVSNPLVGKIFVISHLNLPQLSFLPFPIYISIYKYIYKTPKSHWNYLYWVWEFFFNLLKKKYWSHPQFRGFLQTLPCLFWWCYSCWNGKQIEIFSVKNAEM